MPNDFLIDANSEMTFSGGDLATGEATRQHQTGLVLTEKGEIRNLPTRGVGARSWLNDDQSGNLHGAVKREFEADGMTVERINGNVLNLQIEAKYGDADGDS